MLHVLLEAEVYTPGKYSDEQEDRRQMAVAFFRVPFWDIV